MSRFFVQFSMAVLFALAAYCQVFTASISGVVTDNTGAVLPGATTVTLKQVERD